MRAEFSLWLDTSKDYVDYYQYRSSEKNDVNGRPVIDGVYVWKPEVGQKPPSKMKLVLEWDEDE